MDGKTLISWGMKPGPHFKQALAVATELEAQGIDERIIVTTVLALQPVDKLELSKEPVKYKTFASPETKEEIDNMREVYKHMNEIMRLPTVIAGAIMPDACPAGNQLGTIPVGGVVACDNAIHPAFHSSDVCCSVAITLFDSEVPVKTIMDIAEKVTHFGPGGRNDNNAEQNEKLKELVSKFESNLFLSNLEEKAYRQYMTQGDGNHFFMLGKCFDNLALVTHHGSRGVGAELYKRGKKFAERQTRRIANVPDHQAWIVADSYEGKEYWKALQLVREWTKLNHFGIHDEILKTLGGFVIDRWWNEHNFVFQKEPDGAFYHAKGATPVYDDYYPNTELVQLASIPLNMREGVLIVETSSSSINKTNHNALGFAPHGAGRNISRTAHMKKLESIHGSITPEMQNSIIEQETDEVDVRFWTGRPDLSELPSAYKNADKIIAEIKESNLVKVVTRVNPLGSIMAGDCKTFH